MQYLDRTAWNHAKFVRKVTAQTVSSKIFPQDFSTCKVKLFWRNNPLLNHELIIAKSCWGPNTTIAMETWLDRPETERIIGLIIDPVWIMVPSDKYYWNLDAQDTEIFSTPKVSFTLTRTLAGWIHTYACGTSVNGRFVFVFSRTLVANRQLLFCPKKFVKNFLAVLLVVSVCL